MSRIDICGIRIDNVSFKETIGKIEGFISDRSNVYAVTPNIDHIVKLQMNEEFRNIYSGASLVLADGMPVIWASKFLGTPLKERISGADLFTRLCAAAAEKRYKVFFLGGREGAASGACEALRKRYPDIQIAGFYSPPFGFENDENENVKIVNMVKAANPDILFVGLGAPKQEKWIYSHYKELRVPVSIGIGAAFEFVSGMVKRAPRWMQKAGLEWLWRLLMEPGRLWKRYLVEDMRFFWLVLKQKYVKRTT